MCKFRHTFESHIGSPISIEGMLASEVGVHDDGKINGIVLISEQPYFHLLYRLMKNDMRAPKRKIPLKRRFVQSLPNNAMTTAESVSYVGSPEHKKSITFAGSPQPRRDASLCDIRFATQQEMLTDWLRDTIRKGCCSDFGCDSYPKYAWYKDGDIVYEARLVNSGTGDYKGYPLSAEEWPSGIEEYYG